MTKIKLSPGDRVIDFRDGEVATIIRMYDDVGIAIIELDKDNHIDESERPRRKVRYENLIPYEDVEESAEPKRRGIFDKLKENFLRRSYD